MMAANVYRKRSGSVILKENRGESKSEEVAVSDDMTIGAMKDQIVRKLAGGRTTGEISVRKQSFSERQVQIIGGEVLADSDSNSTPKGERALRKKSNSSQAKVMKEEEGTDTKSTMENEEYTRTLKRKRGADGEMVLAYLSCQEKSSPRLRPRQVPTFRMVDLCENDDNRIVDKRIKVYWPDSRKWFSGHIKAFDESKGLHKILYDDGDKEELDLRKERFELEILPNEGFNLKADSISKKRGRGMDDNEVCPLMLPETAFKAGDAEEVMDSPQLDVKAKEVMDGPQLDVKAKEMMMTPELKKKNGSKNVNKSGTLKLQWKGTKVKEDLAAKMEKVDADMEVDVKRNDKVKKDILDPDVSAGEAMKVDRKTDEKIEALAEVVEKNVEASDEVQATALDLAAENNKIGLEDGNIDGDPEQKKKQAETENITASENAVVSSILSFCRMKDNVKDLPPNVEVSVHTEKVEEIRKGISAQEPPVVDSGENHNKSKLLSEAAGEVVVKASADLQQPQKESAIVLASESVSTSPSKLHLPKNHEEANLDIQQQNLEVEKCQPEEFSKKEIESASYKAVEGGKTRRN